MPGYATMGFFERPVSQPLWRALCDADRPMSVGDLHLITAAKPKSIHYRLRSWERAGVVVATQSQPRRFIMAENTKKLRAPPTCKKGVLVRRNRSARERIWSAMRVLVRFDLPNLQIAAGVTRASAQSYVNCLVHAGYIRRTHAGNARLGEHASYQLIRRSGLLAPKINHSVDTSGARRRVVIDPNDGSVRPGSPQSDGGVG